MIYFHKNNKKAAINLFIEEHWETIYRLSVRLTRCPVDGQDLAHDVVVRIISQQKTLTSKQGATAWIARVTYHLFIDQWRQKKNLQTKTYDNQSIDKPEALTKAWENQPCTEPGPEYAAELSQRQQQIIDALAQMSEPHRLLLTLT